MIKHVVMWKLKDNVAGNSKGENAREIKQRLEALLEAMPEIRRLEVGLNVKDSERAADVVLCSEFDSPEAPAAYPVPKGSLRDSRHPAHQEVVAFVRELVS